MALLSNINDKFAVDSTGAIQFNGQVGTSGYVLKSNANAAPTWVDPSTVIGGPYLPLSGGTLTGALAGTSATFAGNITGSSVLANSFMEIRSDTASFYFENAANNNYYRLKRSSNDFVIDYYNGTTTSDRLTINSSGNVGISGAPDLWYTGYTGVNIGYSGAIFSNNSASDTNVTALVQNAYLNSGATAWVYKRSDEANMLQLVNGEYRFYQASSGTAGNSISWNQNMTIDNSGNIGIKNTSPSDFLSWQQQLVVGSGSADAGITLYHGSGSGNQGAIVFADGNTGTDRYRGSISYNGADEMKFFTSTAERMRIDSSGHIYQGTVGETANKYYYFQNSTTADAGLVFKDNASTNSGFLTYNHGDDAMKFGVTGSERMRITSGGNIQINGGDIFLNSGANYNDKGVVYLSNERTAIISDIVNLTANGDTSLDFQTRSVGTRASSMFIDQFRNVGITASASLRFNGTGDNTHAVGYDSVIDGSFLRGQNGMRFLTGTGGGSEKMRISSDGYLNAGGYTTASNTHHKIVTTRTNSETLRVENNSATPYGQIIRHGSAAPNTTDNWFLVCEDNAFSRLIIWSNGNVINRNNSYGGYSDIKLKENIVDATPKLDDLIKVKIRNYNLIGDDKKQIGVVAQELEEVFPSMIDESKIPDSEDETLYKGVKYSVFVPMLIKAIQELEARVKELENK